MRQRNRARAALALATGLGLTLIGFAVGLLGLKIGSLLLIDALAVDAIAPWLVTALAVPALLASLFLLRRDVRERRRSLDDRLDEIANSASERFDELGRRFDQVDRELAALRERTAGIEGTLEAAAASDAASAGGAEPVPESSTPPVRRARPRARFLDRLIGSAATAGHDATLATNAGNNPAEAPHPTGRSIGGK